MTQATGVDTAELSTSDVAEKLMSRYTAEDAADSKAEDAGSETESTDSGAELSEEAPPEEGVAESEGTEESSQEDSEDTADQEPQEDEEGVTFETVAELAEALDLSLDDFLAQVQIETKASGQVERLSLQELQRGYQREADYTRKTQDLAEQRNAFEANLAAEQARLTQTHAELAALVNASEQALLGEMQSANLEQLRATDPGEYAARVQDFQLRQSQIAQIREQGVAQWQAEQQGIQAKVAGELQQQLAKEEEALSAALPEWQSEETRAAEQKQIGDYLMSQGYQPAELNNLVDHRDLLVARKAMLYDQLQAKGKKVAKKVKHLPKVLKPGSKTAKSTRLHKALDEKRSRLKKSGSVEDAAALLLERMR